MNKLRGRTVEAARREAAAQLKSAGIETPELDARLLVGAILDLDHTALSIQASRVVTHGEADLIGKYVDRRAAHEPVARILGHKEFWGLDFQLSSATLVPRPDTETVVSVALEWLGDQGKLSSDIRIADIGTGSGAILLALLSECSNAHGIGTDINADALATAAANAVNHVLADRACFVISDYAAALSGTFDLIVSNPPYIPSENIAELEIDVRDHDPHLALDGGPDGLNAYRIIAPQAARLLMPGGALIVEVGLDQSAEVGRIMRTADWLSGHLREPISAAFIVSLRVKSLCNKGFNCSKKPLGIWPRSDYVPATTPVRVMAPVKEYGLASQVSREIPTG